MKPMLPCGTHRLRPMTKVDANLGLLQVLLTAADVRRFLCDDKILSEAESAAILSESDRLDPEGLGFRAVEAASGVISGIVGLLPVSAPLEQRLKTVGGVEPTIALDRADHCA